MTTLTSIYQENHELYKSLNTARLTVHAEEAIKNIFGNPKLNKFELYQQLHSAIPYLKHVVHNPVKQTWRFIFKEQVNLEIFMTRESE